MLGSLLHLLSLLARVRDLRRPLPIARPVRDGSLVTIALVAILALAAARNADLALLDTPATGAVVAIYVVLGALVVGHAAQALRAGRRGA